MTIWLNTLINPGAVQNSNAIPISYDGYQQWNVVGSTAGATAVALDNSKSQAFVGNAGADLFVGGDKSDLLIGAGGADTLQGRGGSDLLIGGAGFDSYLYQADLGDNGLDMVVDSDGSGVLVLDGQQLTGGAQYGDARVSRDAQGHIYTQAGGGRLIVDGKFVIERWSAGQLGLDLTGPVAPVNPATTRTITGDLAFLDVDPTAAGLQTGTDDLGNILRDPNQEEPGKADVFYDSTGNDLIFSGGGNDILAAIRGGSDVIDAGAGRDNVNAGAGDDVIYGGSEGDVLAGGLGNDRLFAQFATSVAAAIAAGNTDSASASKGDFLAGNAGDDTLMAGATNDALTGGGGSDLIVGGAGDDELLGDID